MSEISTYIIEMKKRDEVRVSNLSHSTLSLALDITDKTGQTYCTIELVLNQGNNTGERRDWFPLSAG
jgi:hypothetical protein